MLACTISTPVSGVGTDIPPDATPIPPPLETVEYQIYNTQVFFWVEIPAGVPPNENITLNLVDEVTGLPYNTHRSQMVKVDETHYGVTLQVQVGSVLKYFYSRGGQNDTAREYTARGAPVRYRLLYVDGPVEIHDIVTRWNDTAAANPAGRIKGRITDQETGRGIPDILVSAGGVIVLTASDGSFTLVGLPEGKHMVTAYAMEGNYLPAKQNAQIAPLSATPVNFSLQKTRMVPVRFTIRVPEDTPEALSLRLAGNLYQLGNTFSDLGGGVSGASSRMPVFARVTPNIFQAEILLPAGIDIRYKYTLADGFWNAEHDQVGAFVLRQIIIPIDAESYAVSEEVNQWEAGPYNQLWFHATTPINTPPNEHIYIQFKLSDWMSPVPMTQIRENTWGFLLISPTNLGDELTYRYCRNAICPTDRGPASEATVRTASLSRFAQDPQVDLIAEWMNFPSNLIPASVLPNTIYPKSPAFIAGVGLSPDYLPNQEDNAGAMIANLSQTNANLIILRPSWTVLQYDPPIFQLIPGKDQTWRSITYQIFTAQQNNLGVAIFPYLDYATIGVNWPDAYSVNNGLWPAWFERYRTFILHHARLAEAAGAEALIIDGVQLVPALDGITSQDWNGLMGQIRNTFHGQISLYMPFEWLNQPPPIVFTFDQVYVHWGVPLATWSAATAPEIQARVDILLDAGVKPFKQNHNLEVILSIDYPSAEGGLTNCVSLYDSGGSCIDPALLSPRYPDIPTVELDLQEQVEIYNAILAGVNERDWIDGVVALNYYLPVGLHDKSSSIHGKPAELVLRFWLAGFFGK